MLCCLFSGVLAAIFLCNRVKHEKRCQTPKIAVVKPTCRIMVLFYIFTQNLIDIDYLTYYCLLWFFS